MLLNVFFIVFIWSVHCLLNLGADARNYLFPQFMTESFQREILNVPEKKKKRIQLDFPV